MSEKFSLKWNDFQSNWNKAINNLHKDTDFADVTLISDDKVKFSAHKILLSNSSNMFKFILKGTNQNNSLLFLRGVSSKNLGFILEYIYQGVVNLQPPTANLAAHDFNCNSLQNNNRMKNKGCSQKFRKFS